ncbi:L-amino-acid oxidase-like, partial [Mercenaria mercenaria]|uniref:L-amino-acid oxidase-like n=1 Tax=Mercenaria mercenaria TaxID=6596 RepID=UPI00234E5DD3
DRCDDTAIIGAGVTGSYAAWRLRERYLTISMYEYSNRIGGRCFTVQLPGIPDVNVEMGAMRFLPDEHPLVVKTVHHLGLEVVDFELGVGPSNDSLYYLRGKHMKYSELPTQAPYYLPPENRIDRKTLHRYSYENFTVSSQNGNVIQSLDGVSCTCKGKSKIMHFRVRDLFMAKYLDTETTHYLRDSASFHDGFGPDVAALNSGPVDPVLPSGKKAVKTGFQSIPEGLVGQFLQACNKHSFYYNRHLKAIKRNVNGNYILTFQPTVTTAGVTTDDKRRPVVKTCAKKVLLAIPRLALEHLDWEGLRQETVQDYLKYSLKEIHAAKIYFGYDNAWWRNITMATKYAVSMTPLRQTYDFGVSKTNSKGVLNTGYSDGDTRMWREALSSGKRVPGIGDNSIAMTNLSVYLARKYYAEIFNIADVPQPNSAVMTVWDQYPIGASWYSWAPGYKWDEVESRMIKPSAIDDVYITSNVFSSSGRSGWIQGGMEMVEKVLKYLK